MSPMFIPANPPVHMVNELIDSDNWSCRTELVRETFSRPDADAILNIPLRSSGGEDSFAWAHEPNGIYSVKSVYRSLVNKKDASSPHEGTLQDLQLQNNRCGVRFGKLMWCPR